MDNAREANDQTGIFVVSQVTEQGLRRVTIDMPRHRPVPSLFSGVQLSFIDPSNIYPCQSTRSSPEIYLPCESLGAYQDKPRFRLRVCGEDRPNTEVDIVPQVPSARQPAGYMIGRNCQKSFPNHWSTRRRRHTLLSITYHGFATWGPRQRGRNDIPAFIC